jgi:hypothetical protein
MTDYSRGAMYRVYLDQWAWIELAKAASGKSTRPAFSAFLEIARYGVEHGYLAFPVSVVHYMELANTANARQRRDVGEIMHELSRDQRMISPISSVISAEFDAALHKRYGVPEFPRAVQIFGLGVGHAFGMGSIAGRLVSREGHPAEPIDPVLKAKIETWANDYLEKELLCGPRKGETIPGYDPNAHKVFAEKFVKAEEDQAKKFQKFNVDSAYQKRVLTAREWILLNEEIAGEALIRAGIDPVWFFEQGAEFLTDFLKDLPIIYAQVEMRRLQHQNKERKWSTHDHYDVVALSMAVVHCDAVVTEKHWAHLLRLAKLDKMNQTRIVDGKSLQQLVSHLLTVPVPSWRVTTALGKRE